MKAVYSCHYNVFIAADEAALSAYLHYEWIYKPNAVKVWNTETHDWDWVPLGLAVYSDYYGIHIITDQAVYSNYHCSYIFKEEAEYSSYLNSYVDRRDKDLVKINNDYLPKIKFDDFVYSSVYGKYIREEKSVYSQYHDTYLYSDETIFSKYLDSYILRDEVRKVWNVDISDFDWVPADMAIYCPSRGYYIIENQSKYSDYYEHNIPIDDNITYSYEVDSYVDDRDPRFMRLYKFFKEDRQFYTYFMYAPKTYLKKLKNGDMHNVFVVFDNGNCNYIKAIITFGSDEKLKQFLSENNKMSFLQNKFNLEEGYFQNTNMYTVDAMKEYLNRNDEEYLMREIDRADCYVIE